jgi:selenide,water dikinase
MKSPPTLQDLVLVGGGHAHVEVLRSFAMRPLAGTRLTLVSAHSTGAYSGMLPGHVAGHYSADEIHIDLRRLANAAGARFIRARVGGLDPAARTLNLEGRPDLSYDLLSLDIGSVPNMELLAGEAVRVLPVKPIDRFLERLAEVTAKDRPQRIGVIGGGAAGVEIVLALRHRLGGSAGHEFSIWETAPDILPGFNDRARRRMRSVLRDKNIAVHAGCAIRRADDAGITLEDGTVIGLDVIACATGAAAPAWLGETGLELDAAGFIRVNHHLRTPGIPTVFAAGDIAVIDGDRLPRSGVYAVRQGPILAANLRSAARGEPTTPYRPQRRFLSLLSTGPRHAIAARNGLALAGDWVWRWKNRIDQRFMQRYAELPMAMGDQTADTKPDPGQTDTPPLMPCKGCGSKLGPTALSGALGRLRALSPAVDLSNPDDAAILTPPAGHALLQTVDFFPALVSDPYLFGRIAAVHCLGDLHAMGAQPWTALALAQIPHGSEAIMEEDLFQMLAGAVSIFEAEGITMVGGHSVAADELGVGFTLNGLALEGDLRRKSGLRAGDALILTKPLGTGVLFAADMRGIAKPRWIDAALQQMVLSNGPAAALLIEHGATGMTDVTGFGLGGHLGEMLRASGLDAEISPSKLPVHDGVAALLDVGVESSLAPQNTRQILALLGDQQAGTPETWTPGTLGLLADPQTAGGLLAGVPADRAQACLEALQRADHQARIIGRALPCRSESSALHLAPAAL